MTPKTELPKELDTIKKSLGRLSASKDVGTAEIAKITLGFIDIIEQQIVEIRKLNHQLKEEKSPWLK